MLKRVKRNTVQSISDWKMSTAPFFYEAYNDNPLQDDPSYQKEQVFETTVTVPIYQEMKSSPDNQLSTNHLTNSQNSRPSLAERTNSESRMQTNGQARSHPSRAPLPPEPKEDLPFQVPRKPAGHQTVSELQKALDEAHEQLDRFVEQRASLHSNDQFRAGDDRIGRESDALRADIRQWSRKFTRSTKRQGFKDKFKDEQENPFSRVTHQYQTYLHQDNGKGTSLLVQGYVWMKLRAEVFHKFVWLGGPCEKKRNSIANGEECDLARSFKPLNALLLSLSTQFPLSLFSLLTEWQMPTKTKRRSEAINYGEPNLVDY